MSCSFKILDELIMSRDALADFQMNGEIEIGRKFSRFLQTDTQIYRTPHLTSPYEQIIHGI